MDRILDLTERFQILIDSLIYHGVCDNRSETYIWLAERIHLSSSTVRGYDLVKNRSIRESRLLKSFSVVSQVIDKFIEIKEDQFKFLPLVDVDFRSLQELFCGVRYIYLLLLCNEHLGHAHHTNLL